jgi:hypothetical protein
MAPYQSQRTTDTQAKIAAYTSDLVIETPDYEALKAKPNLNEAERRELAIRKGRINSIKEDLAEFNADLVAAQADDNSVENVAKRAAAWGDFGKVHSVAPDVQITHASGLDEHFGNVHTAARARSETGKKMSKLLTDSIHKLAKNDYLAADRTVGSALPRLRMHSLDDAKALANWFQRITIAAGCQQSISAYLTFHYGIDETTCSSVAERQAEFVSTRLADAIKDNGLAPADIAPSAEPTSGATAA